MIPQSVLSEAELETAINALARRTTSRYWPQCVPIGWWQRLCAEMGQRMVVDGVWRGREAGQWADDKIDEKVWAEMQREPRA